jgi:hypothetical protein
LSGGEHEHVIERPFPSSFPPYLLAACVSFNVAEARAESGVSSEPHRVEGEIEPTKPEGETEFTILPFVGGDTDVGIGGGYIASLARVEPNRAPYLWRVESAGSVTFKPEGDGVGVPYLDNYVLLNLPHVIPNQVGLNVRVSFTHERNITYYGLGNASAAPPEGREEDPYYRYTWTHPKLDVSLEYDLGRFRLTTGMAYTHNELDIPDDSLIREDSQSPDEDVRRLTAITPEHGVAVFTYGVGWDTRDSEVSPEQGSYHTLRFDIAPGATNGIPYRWMRNNLALRQYVPLMGEQLQLAVRLVVDALVGEPPFYELARFDSTNAIGGGKGMRGIPARRYHGMLKVLSNTELRYWILSFDLLNKINRLGLVGFADVGRLWADYGRLSELDGEGLGLKIGIGGGVRVLAGKSFVLRADAATSTDAGGFGGYLAAGHIF